MEYKGNIETKFKWIIPVLLGVSTSTIKTKDKPTGGIIYTLHITPLFSIGINWRTKEK